ncbi:MAG: hypothetical protein AB1585_20100 [Thermodesulfobacteriota bacterium]
MNPLLPWPEMRQLAFSGGSILFFGEAMSRLSAYMMGRFSLQGKSVLLVDAAQAFDPYLVARMGRWQGVSARLLLERIRLSRTFTCHQLATLLCETLPGEKVNGPLIVLGPCSLFYDDQVALKERLALFQKMTVSLRGLQERGEGLYLFQPPLSRHVRKHYFGRYLAGSVRWVIRVSQGDKTLEGRLVQSGFEEKRLKEGRG